MPELIDDDVHTVDGQIEMIHPVTLERRGFVDGLFMELHSQLHHHIELVEQMATLQARIEITERNLALTRDHLLVVLSRSDDAVPPNWQTVLAQVRFVGVRLGDACLEVLKEHPTLTTQELLDALNRGQFRFRTGAPLREINAALLRHPRIKRVDDRWYFEPEGQEVRRN